MSKLKDFPPVYYISLSDSIDRQKSFTNQFLLNGIENVKMVEAYDGRKINYCIENDTVDGLYFYQMDSGGIAAAISHLKAIKEWYNNSDSEYAIFFEDDMTIRSADDWNFTWKDFIEALPKNWKAIQLSLIKENGIEDSDMKLNSRNWWNWSAGAYLIRRNYAKELIEHFYQDNKYYLQIKDDNDIIPCIEHCLFLLANTDAYTIPLFYEDTSFVSTFYQHFIKQTHKGSQIDASNYVKYWWKIKGRDKNLDDLNLKVSTNDYIVNHPHKNPDCLMNKIHNFPNVLCVTTTNAASRLSNFVNQCQNYEISNYTIFSFKPYKECQYNIRGPLVDQIHDNSKGPVTSHLKALYSWYKNTLDEYVLVFEDDVDLTTIDYWNFTWEDFFDALPKDWECVQLCSIRESFNDIPMVFRRRLNSDWGCQAYLVNRKYVKKLIDKYYSDPDEFNLNTNNIKTYFNLDQSETRDLIPIVENVLFEGLSDTVYNFPLFAEDIINTNSNFGNYNDFPTTEPHHVSHKYINEWWKHIGCFLNIKDIFRTDSDGLISIIIVKDEHLIQETEFLLSLLPENYTKTIEFYSNNQSDNKRCDILIYRIFGLYLDQLKEIIQKTKAKVIINIGDEFGGSNQAFDQLACYTDLYLRQYNHENYEYSNNTIHIPLGFCNKIRLINESIKNINQKKYNWSWFGALKSDRHEMLEKFKLIDNYTYAHDLDGQSIAKTYNDSIFVPCGRGNVVLDCYRLYEASSCGAIPVVVGTKEEIQTVFKYEENPPWIFADSWEQAAITCKTLLSNKRLLQDVQNDLILWWKTRINNIKEKILNAINTTKNLNHICYKDFFGEDWFSYPCLYRSMVQLSSNGAKFVEIGSWKGKSSSYMAVEIANSNKNIDFHCVDTWEGSIEHKNDSKLNELYDTFNDNMKSLKQYHKTIRLPSTEAAKKFEDNSLDFVFIDASHVYEDVKADIIAWLPKVKSGGVLAGHDYYANNTDVEGVKLAVDELLDGVEISIREKCWIYYKP